MTRRQALAIASSAYVHAAQAFQGGMISRAELDRALETYIAAQKAARARRVVC